MDDSHHNDKLLFKFLPSLTKLMDNSKLQAMKTASKIYTKETYMEFHVLLCEQLTLFHTSLDKLREIQNSGDHKLDQIRQQLGYNSYLRDNKTILI